jgi:hypothetical protein
MNYFAWISVIFTKLRLSESFSRHGSNPYNVNIVLKLTELQDIVFRYPTRGYIVFKMLKKKFCCCHNIR